MRRAIAIMSKEPGRAEQLDAMLESDDFAAVGEFAATHCQRVALALRPWETVPVDVVDIAEALKQPAGDQRGDHRAAALLQRLLDAGLSRYEPAPLLALARVEHEAVP
jgi:hypothetical protein